MARPSRPMGLTPLILFGCLWAAFGVWSFFGIGKWVRAYNRKMAMIQSGVVQPRTFYVTRIEHDRDEGNWGFWLNQRSGSSRLEPEDVYETVTKLDGLALGTPVPAYLIEGKWFVPRFSGGFSWGKWALLAFSLAAPLLVITGALAIGASHKRAAMRPAVAIEPQAGQVPAAALPQAFSVDRLHFNARPTDDQLLALLGSPEYTDLFQVEDDAARQTLRVRPGRLPVRLIMPWMMLVAAAITAVLWMENGLGVAGTNRIAALAMVAFIWVGVLPVMFGTFLAINSHFGAQPDYFEADFLHGSLSLPRADITLSASQIECFTVVERWFWRSGSWLYMCQIGILARHAQSGFDYCLVFSDRTKRRKREQLADRLANGFQKPLHHVALTRSQSKLLPAGT